MHQQPEIKDCILKLLRLLYNKLSVKSKANEKVLFKKERKKKIS